MHETAENSTDFDDLTPKQYRAIANLMLCNTVEEAAQESGIGARTLWTWLKEPTFRDALAEAERNTVEAATRRLSSLASKALGVVESIMEDESASDAVRLRAAATVLDSALRWREVVTLEDRLSALEMRI